MSSSTHWLLTDAATSTWHDHWHVDHGKFAHPWPWAWSMTKRTLGGGRSQGVDAIEVNNGALSFTVLPTRGMGLWRGSYRGLQLGWQSPLVGPVHPQWVHLENRGGLGWLDGFDEWICRCGLHSNGPPVRDPLSGRLLPLHGRIANLPATRVTAYLESEPQPALRVEGVVDEGAFFFGRLRLTANLRTVLGSNRLTIHDVVENLGSKPADLMLLYHCQFGPPFLEQGSHVHAPIDWIAPRDQRAAEGMATFDQYDAPHSGFAEQVYYHGLRGDNAGATMVVLHNREGDKGVAVRFQLRELPCFITWKNTGAFEDGYVVGLEPATNFPNPKPFEQAQGRVVQVPPGGNYETTLHVEVFDSAESVQEAMRAVNAIQGQAQPQRHEIPLHGYAP